MIGIITLGVVIMVGVTTYYQIKNLSKEISNLDLRDLECGIEDLSNYFYTNQNDRVLNKSVVFENRNNEKISFTQIEDNTILMSFSSQLYRITKGKENEILSVNPFGGPYISRKYEWGYAKEFSFDMGEINNEWKGLKVIKIDYSNNPQEFKLTLKKKEK